MKRFCKTSLLIAVALVNLVFAARGDAAESSAQQAQISQHLLEAGVASLREAVETDDLRGAVVLVARDGKIVLHEAVGWRDKEQGLPMRKDTLFHMASNTKPVIATAILLLAEEGKLSLDDLVRKYLPSFDNYRSGQIRIRHLLSHTSGFRIPGIFLKPLLEKSPEHPNAPSLLAEVARFGKIGAEVAPGTTYQYSNPGYNTLGALIEVVSDKPLDVFLRERIYRPLGMNESWNHESKAPAERLGVVYKRDKGTWTIFQKPTDPPRYPFVRGSGGMITSAADYFRFCQMFLNGGILNGKRILSEKSVRMATAPQTLSIYSREQTWKRSTCYGFGWQVSHDGVFAHGGSEGTYAWVDPRNKVVGLFFTQCPSGKYRRQFQKVVEAAVDERK